MDDTITFSGSSLSAIGATRYTSNRRYDPAPPEIPERIIETHTLVVKLLDGSADGINHKLNLLRSIFAKQSGLLEVGNQDGHAINKHCRILSDDIGDVITRGKTEVTITLESDAAITHEEGKSLLASIKPDGHAKINLSNVRDLAESTRCEHPAENTGARTRSINAISFTARVFSPAYDLTAAQKLTAINERKAYLENINSKGGQLEIHGESRRIIIDQLDFKAEASGRWLEVSFSGHRVTYPDDSSATAVYRASTSQDCTTGKINLTISGEITAATKEAADARIDSIIASWEEKGYSTVSKSPDNQYVEGADAPESEWLTSSFSVSMERQAPGFIGFELTVTTSTRPQDGRRTISYRGTVHAETSAQAIEKARELGKNKHAFPSIEEESIETATDCSGVAKFQQCTFSYEYDTNDESSTITSANIKLTTDRPTFGDWTAQASGTINAATAAAAINFARSLIPTGCLIREDNISESRKIQRGASGLGAETSEFVSIDFSFTTLIPHENTAAQYTVSFVPDYEKFTGTTTYSGSIWAPTEAAARAAIRQLGTSSVISLYGSRSGGDPIPISEQSTVAREIIVSEGSSACFTRLDFTVSYEADLSGTPGYDIIDAEWTLERIPQIARAVIDEIPYGSPYAQLGVATTVGRLVATGSITARQLQTARQWAHSREQYAASFNGYSGIQTEPPRESSTQSYSKRKATNTRTFRFDFSYPYDYIAGLSGLWPQNLTPD